MKGLVLFILTLVVMASLSFVAASIYINDTQVKKETERSQIIEFSTFTSAVCENKEEFVNCKDEVFVNCNGKISKAVDIAECNGIKLEVPKTLGFAVFEKEWRDPRG